MSQRTSPSATVCLGFDTALSLVTAARDAELPLARARRTAFPSQAPLATDREAARCAIESLLPELTLSKPLRFVTGSTKRCRASQDFVSHQCIIPEGVTGLLRFDDDILVSDIPLALTQLATRLSFIDLLELSYEICGTYRRGQTNEPTRFNTAPLTSKKKIAAFLRRNPRIPGAAKLRDALRYVTDLSASPRETKCALLFGLPACRGGYGLGIPLLNYEVHCSPAARAIAETKTLRCDLFWKETGIALEYQSREFHEGERHRIRDSRRANALRAMGITMVGITDNELDSLFACDGIATTLRTRAGKRSYLDAKKAHSRKLALRRSLGLPLEPRRTFEVRTDAKDRRRMAHRD